MVWTLEEARKAAGLTVSGEPTKKTSGVWDLQTALSTIEQEAEEEKKRRQREEQARKLVDTTIDLGDDKSFFERAKETVTSAIQKVGRFFTGGDKVKVPEQKQIVIPDELKKKYEDSYLKFPSFFPNPDIVSLDFEYKTAQPSAKLTPEGEVFYKNLIKDPVDTILDATRDSLTYHPKALKILAEAQDKIENTPWIGIKKNPFLRGITRGVANQYLGSSDQVMQTFEQRLYRPETFAGKTVETVGDVIGNVLAFLAGGAVLKGIGLGKATLPVLFATLGQLSTSQEVELKRRLAKIPVDAMAGWLFHYLPADFGISSKALKSMAGASGVMAGQGFIDSLIEGMKPKDAAKIAATQAIIGGLFHVFGTSMKLLDDAILSSATKKGKVIFTPEQLRSITERLKEGKAPRAFIEYLNDISNKASRAGKNIELDIQAFRRRWLARKLGLKKPEGIKTVAKLVDRPKELPGVKRIKKEGIPEAKIVSEKPKVEPKIETLGKEVTVYRGAKDHTIDVTRPNGITGGVSFSLSKDVAKKFAEKSGGTVKEYRIKSDARVVNHSDLEKMFPGLKPKELTEKVKAWLKDNNIDVVRFDVPEKVGGEAELRVINDRVLEPVSRADEFEQELYKKYNVDSYKELRKVITDEEFNKLIELRRKEEGIKPISDDGIITKQEPKDIDKTLKNIPEELRPLAKEARKYKSAEDFVKGVERKRLKRVLPKIRKEYQRLLRESRKIDVTKSMTTKEYGVFMELQTLGNVIKDIENILKTGTSELKYSGINLPVVIEKFGEKPISYKEIQRLTNLYNQVTQQLKPTEVAPKIKIKTPVDLEKALKNIPSKNRRQALLKAAETAKKIAAESKNAMEFTERIVKLIGKDKNMRDFFNMAGWVFEQKSIASGAVDEMGKPAQDITFAIAKFYDNWKKAGAMVKPKIAAKVSFDELIKNAKEAQKEEAIKAFKEGKQIIPINNLVLEMDGLVPEALEKPIKNIKELINSISDYFLVVDVKPKKQPQKTGVDKQTKEIVELIELQSGKPIEKTSVVLMRKILDEKTLPINEVSTKIAKKLAPPAKGIDKEIFETRPSIFYGLIPKSKFTDGMILINDDSVAKKAIDEFLSKEKIKIAKRLYEENPKLTASEIKKLVEEEVKSKIDNLESSAPNVDALVGSLKESLSKIKKRRKVKYVGYEFLGHRVALWMTDGEHNVAVDFARKAFLEKYIKNFEYVLLGKTKPVLLVRGDKILGAVMPINKDYPFKEGVVKTQPTTRASIGEYADIPIQNQGEFKPSIPFPEMVRLAKELMSKYPIIKKPRARKTGVVYGLFVPKDDGSIVLNPEIFKNVDVAAKTLAHEIGHLIDYLPDKTLARGNLFGRIATLRRFLRRSFTNIEVEREIKELRKTLKKLRAERKLLRDEDGVVTDKNKDRQLLNKIKSINKRISKLQENAIKYSEIRDELWELSKKWRPLGDYAGGSYLRYRKSSEELYADAISVLLNNPQMLKNEAPKFYDLFFKFLHRKPTVKKAYFDLVDLLNQPDDVVQTERIESLYQGFKKAQEKRLEIERKPKYEKPWIERLMKQHVTRFDPIYRKLDKKFKDHGLFTSPKTKIRMQLEEMMMRRNEAYLYLDKINKDIIEPLEMIGLSEDDLGVLLTLERNLGDRKDIANPYGLQGKYSKEVLEYFKKYLKDKKGVTDEQFNVLQQVARKFREYQFKVVEEATKAQLYSKKFFEETAKPNKDTYVTYQVVDYIHKNYVSAGIKKATGTLKEIENPFVSSVLKTMAILDQTEIQKAKLAVIEQLKTHFPDEISKSKPVKARAGVRVRWKPVENKAPLELYEDGKWTAYDVDPYIKEMFDLYSPTEIHTLVKVAGNFNRIFKPLVTTWNISWGAYSNIFRDTRRTYKNLATIIPAVTEGEKLSIFEFIKKWIGSLPEGVKFERGEITPLMKEMLENKAYSASFAKFDTQANEDKSIAVIMRKFKFLQPKTDVKDITFKKRIFDKTLGKILRGIEFVGSVFETTTKAAGYQILSEKVKNAKLAGYITRNYVGTPNFIDGGTQKYIDNNIFVFSNVMIQGVRADLELATHPNTRGGYWFRTFILDILPKLFMVVAASGLLGQKLKEAYDKMTEYDKTNYITIPIPGIRPNGKVVYWRIPQDETGRLFGALAWKLGTALSGEVVKPLQVLSVGAGYLPSPTPLFEIVDAWLSLIQGKRPYDRYKGRYVIDDLTWRAGGFRVMKKMFMYTTNQLGFSQFTTYSNETDTTLDLILKHTPIINRAIKSTDYGLTEKEREIKAEIDKKNAQRLLDEREKIDQAIKEFRKNPDNIDKILDNLIKNTVGSPPYDKKQRSRIKRIKKKFNIGIIKGTISREMDGLIEANTNEYKIRLLRIYKKTLTEDEFNRLVREARHFKVISSEVVRQLKKEGLFKGLISLGKKIKFPKLVKEAYAAEGIEINGVRPKSESLLDRIKKALKRVNFIDPPVVYAPDTDVLIKNRVIKKKKILKSKEKTKPQKRAVLPSSKKQRKIAELVRKYFPDDPETAIAVFMQESQLGKYKQNLQGAPAYGVAQIYLPAHRDKIPGKTDKEKIEWLLDPENNLKFARKLYEKYGWKPWVAYTSGKYKKFMR